MAKATKGGPRSGMPQVPGYMTTKDVCTYFGVKDKSGALLRVLRELKIGRLTVGGEDGKRPIGFLYSCQDIDTQEQRIRVMLKGPEEAVSEEPRITALAIRVANLERRLRALEASVWLDEKAVPQAESMGDGDGRDASPSLPFGEDETEGR